MNGPKRMRKYPSVADTLFISGDVISLRENLRGCFASAQ